MQSHAEFHPWLFSLRKYPETSPSWMVVSPFFSQIPAAYFDLLWAFAQDVMLFSPPWENLYTEIAYPDHVTLPYWPAFAWSLTRWLSRASSLWRSAGRGQEHGRGLYVPSLENFECGTQMHFFFAISQYILIINPITVFT